MSPEAMSACLELVAQSVTSRPPLADLVDLVTTGPEAGGVANRSTGVVVADLFRSAQRSVLVAGYAIYQGRKIFQSLAERMERCPDLHVRMFLDVPSARGDSSSVSNQIARFVQAFKTSQMAKYGTLAAFLLLRTDYADGGGQARRPTREVYSCRRSTDIVFSANFTEAAQDRNIEVGLLVRSAVPSERLIEFLKRLWTVIMSDGPSPLMLLERKMQHEPLRTTDRYSHTHQRA